MDGVLVGHALCMGKALVPNKQIGVATLFQTYTHQAQKLMLKFTIVLYL